MADTKYNSLEEWTAEGNPEIRRLYELPFRVSDLRQRGVGI